MAVIFALVTLITYGLDFFFVRKGLAKTPNPIVAAFVTLTVNFSFFITLTLIFEPLSSLTPKLVFFFIIAGTLAPGLARLFSYKGIETLGISITAPIVNAEALFAVLMAVLFLNEPVTALVVAGVLSAVTGLVILGYESGKKKPARLSGEIRYRYFFFPVLASIFYGVSVFFRKMGLNVLGSPILGATFTSGTSWVITFIFLMATGNGKGLLALKKESLFYFVIGGSLTCLGWYALFNALHLGRVSIVTPIATSYSLVTLLLSYLLLRETERITPKIVLATILVIAGVVMLSVAK